MNGVNQQQRRSNLPQDAVGFSATFMMRMMRAGHEANMTRP